MASDTNITLERKMCAAGDGALLNVPGCGLPIKYGLDQNKRFRYGVSDAGFDRMTVREVSMLRLMEALTDKPNWSMKVFDESVTEKWGKEALDMPWITEEMWSWCLRELQDKARAYEATKLTTVLDMGSRCVKADDLVPAHLQDALKSAVQPLLTHSPKDWHPGSDEKVLNLVHPSLYPVVYGKSRVLQHRQITLDDSLAPHDNCSILGALHLLDGDETAILGERPCWLQEARATDDRLWSAKFQWLPCDVSFTDETDFSVKIESYINNLHPQRHRPLYPIIESFISLSIPAWNEVLIDSDLGRTPIRIRSTGAITDPDEAPELGTFQIDGPADEMSDADIARVDEYLALPDDPDNERFFEEDEEFDELDDEDYDAKLDWKWKRIRKTIHPEPGIHPSSSYDDWKDGRVPKVVRFQEAMGGGDKTMQFVYKDIDIRKSFHHTGLQVIVKLASIELTPDKPSYDGGNWHLEGMLNERIVATSIYYYDVENITESRIRFRQEAELDPVNMAYPQHDHVPLCQLFGTDSLTNEPAIQEIGSIATPHGRLLAFPNTLQHKVEPFSLVDPTKSGHRRFLVLWLVDPHYRILSTGNVPPQQHEWWAEKAREAVKGKVAGEIQAMIEDLLKDGTMTLEEAKEYRLELMAERTSFADGVQANFREYNFCEH